MNAWGQSAIRRTIVQSASLGHVENPVPDHRQIRSSGDHRHMTAENTMHLRERIKNSQNS
jgi:hypothetical protein